MSMNEHPLFEREVMAWASTLPMAEIQLLELSAGHSVLAIFSKYGRDLLVHLQAINGRGSISRHSENFDPEAARQVTLWEDLWCTKQPIVKSRIAAQLGISERIPARLTQARRLDRPTTLKFMKENHLQDIVVSKFRYGLFLPKKHYRVLKNPPDTDDLLVAAATFAHPRLFQHEGQPHRSFELVRFTNLLNSTVVGGLDKLLSHFINLHQPDDLMTYTDLEWSDGQSYRKLGFETFRDTPPQFFWVDPRTMQRYYPHRLPEYMNEQSAMEHGFMKVQNAGSRKFVKVFTATS